MRGGPALGYLAGRTTNVVLSTATTLITTNDPVRIAEEYAMLQVISGGRMDLMMGRGNTGPVYPWFGKDIRQVPLAIENYALVRTLWEEEVVDWQGKFRTPLQGVTSVPRPLDGVPPFVWHGSIRSPEIAEQAAFPSNPPSHADLVAGARAEGRVPGGHVAGADAPTGRTAERGAATGLRETDDLWPGSASSGRGVVMSRCPLPWNHEVCEELRIQAEGHLFGGNCTQGQAAEEGSSAGASGTDRGAGRPVDRLGRGSGGPGAGPGPGHHRPAGGRRGCGQVPSPGPGRW